VWLEERFKRDFRSPLFSHLLLLLKELDPTESNFLKLILLRINKKKIQENGFNRFSLLMNPYAKTPRVHSRTIVGVVPNQQETKLMEWNVTSVAEQFTLIEVGLFKAIQLVELSNSAWKVANARKNSINVINILNRFDLVCQWASTEVVMAQSPKQRAAIIEKLILVAQKCYELRNYNALMEILAGLNRGSVQRLKQSWDGISSSSLATFKSLQEVVAVWNNYKTYRDTLRKSPLPCIPFFGVYLRDISALELENPEVVVSGEQEVDLNFEKIYRISRIFKDIKMFQQSQYTIEEDPVLLPYLRRLLAMPEDMLLKHSQTIEAYSPSPPLSPSSSSGSPRLPRKSSGSSTSSSHLLNLLKLQ